MQSFRWVRGQMVEVQRFINVPRRWCEQYPARERREIWISADEGHEFKFVVHTALMPARRGHRVLALLMECELVALHNLQTGEEVNYLRSDTPLLWRRCERVAAASIAMGGVLTFVMVGSPVPLGVMAASLIGALGVVTLRWLHRKRLQRAIDRALSNAMQQAGGRTAARSALRRIK